MTIRALAILATRPDATEIKFFGNLVSVARQHLYRYDEGDMAALRILMSDKEFGFAVTSLEDAATELREMQKVWIDAASNLNCEVAA